MDRMSHTLWLPYEPFPYARKLYGKGKEKSLFGISPELVPGYDQEIFTSNRHTY